MYCIELLRFEDIDIKLKTEHKLKLELNTTKERLKYVTNLLLHNYFGIQSTICSTKIRAFITKTFKIYGSFLRMHVLKPLINKSAQKWIVLAISEISWHIEYYFQ